MMALLCILDGVLAAQLFAIRPGVTISTSNKELTMPPSMGITNGFIGLPQGRVYNMLSRDVYFTILDGAKKWCLLHPYR